MATIVTIKRSTGESNKIISALEMIRSGMGTLMELNQMRAEMDSAGDPQFQAAFGAASAGDAQALSYRWNTVCTKWLDITDPTFSDLRDLVNAVVVQ